MKAYFRVNELICWLVPSKSAIAQREFIVDHLKGILSKCLGARMFAIGALTSRTFLPNETIHITPFLCKGQEESWFIRVNEALCTLNSPTSNNTNNLPSIIVERVSFLPSEVKVNIDVNGVNIDISPNELAALYSSSLVEEFNQLVGSDNLFKRSILLIKAWLLYEAPRYVQGTVI